MTARGSLHMIKRKTRRRLPHLRPQRARPAERIAVQLLALFAATDLEALIDAAFPLLRTTVPCDFVSAFYRGAGKGLLKSRDSRGRQHSAAHMRRHVALNPAIPLAAASPGTRILPTRIGLPRSNKALRGMAFYQEIMQEEGWRHSVALCFWGDPIGDLPVFVISVNRGAGNSDFAAREIARLERIHPFVDCAVTRLYEREAARNLLDSMAVAARGGARGFAILDRHLRLAQASDVARRMCATWADDHLESRADDPRAWRLPAALAAGCRELRDEWQSALHANPDVTGLRRRRVIHPRDSALTASITLVGPSAMGLAEPSFVVEFNRLQRGEVRPPGQSVALLRKMTPAERVVASVLAEGLSNQEIADRLGKSIHAVKFLLHRIYHKTGIASRAGIVAMLRDGRPNE